MKTCLVLRHVAFENLGAFEEPLICADYEVRYLNAWDESLASLDPLATDLLVILGGPIGVYEESTYPFLAREIDFITTRLHASRPTIGICLGAQLIARAAGARVYPSGHKEIGFAPITLTPAGEQSCLAPFATAPVTLHWHGDTFDLPEGAQLLASTALCPNQAFSIGPNVIGFQFHPEAGGDIEPWLVGHACELASAGLDIPALRADALRLAPALRAKAHATITTWLSGLTLEL